MPRQSRLSVVRATLSVYPLLQAGWGGSEVGLLCLLSKGCPRLAPRAPSLNIFLSH